MNKLGKIGKIVITPEIKKHIDYYHRVIGSTEWSGILFFKHTGGEIKNLKDLEFTAVGLYLMDIGSAAYTEFEYGSEIVKAYAVIPEAMECLTGKIHTH